VILVEMDSVPVQWVRLETLPGATLKKQEALILVINQLNAQNLVL